MASNLGPGAEFEDAERQSLIDRLNFLLAGEKNHSLSPSLWAALWLSDVGRLKYLIETCNNPSGISENVLKPCMYVPLLVLVLKTNHM